MNEKLRWTARVLSFLFCAALCVTAFIYSAQDGEQSKEKSTALTDAVASTVIADYGSLTEQQRSVSEQRLNSQIRKIAHCLEYMAIGGFSAVFALTFLRSGQTGSKQKKRRVPRREALCALALLYSLLFAAADEIHQCFVPGRAGMIEDVALDFLAASVSVLIIWGVSRAAAKEEPSQNSA